MSSSVFVGKIHMATNGLFDTQIEIVRESLIAWFHSLGSIGILYKDEYQRSKDT